MTDDLKDLSGWEKRWQDGETRWAHEKQDLFLFENFDRLQPSLSGPEVFIPLCGDSPAVPFFLRRGLRVTALEYASEALSALEKRLKQENAPTEKLTLVQKDLFDYEATIQFDLVYDRASLVAIHPALRSYYFSTLNAVTKKGSHYLVEAYSAGDYQAKEPPYPIEPHEIESLFKRFLVEERHSFRAPMEREDFNALGVYEIDRHILWMKRDS